ncbi:zinc-binding dehydrogenase, partial [Peribacillus simplex]
SEERKQKATELGAIVIDPKACDVVEELKQRTGGGVEVAFEVTGVPPVLTQAIHSTKIGGQIMIVSIFETSAPIIPNDIVMKERSITGIIGYRDVFPA